MKKRLVSLALALALCLGLAAVPAQAAMPAKVKLTPGENRTVTTDGGGTSHRWICSDSSVVLCSGSGTRCQLTALKPGTAIVTVYYTLQKPDLAWNPVTRTYYHTYTPYEEHDSCAVIVTDPGTGAAPSLTVTSSESYGTVGQDVSGIATDIKGFNHGLVPVEYNGLWGFADAEMRLVIPFRFSGYSNSPDTSFSDSGYASVYTDSGRPTHTKYVINTRGEAVYATTGRGNISCENGYILVQRFYDSSNSVWEWERYDFSGEEITDEQASRMSDELTRQRREWGDLDYYGNDGTSYYDTGENFLFGPPTAGETKRTDATLQIPKNGKLLLQERSGYNPLNISRVQEGVLVLFDPDTGCYGAVDTSGETVIPFRYEKLYASRGGYLAYKLGDKVGLLENPVNPPAKNAGASGRSADTDGSSSGGSPGQGNFRIVPGMFGFSHIVPVS